MATSKKVSQFPRVREQHHGTSVKMKFPFDVTTRVVIEISNKICSESAKKAIGKGLNMSKKNALPTSNQPKRWTEQEKVILTEKQAKYGNCWKTIASSLPGRTESAVKNRWYDEKKKKRWQAECSDVTLQVDVQVRVK